LIQSDRHAQAAPKTRTFEQVLAEFEAAPVQDVQLSEDDPRLGPQNSTWVLVIFSDFQCPACRRFAQVVAHVREHHPELAVVFKHYPLSKACNPAVRGDLHPLSCPAARAAEAARRQGKFWEYHDAMFATDEELNEATLLQLAQAVGLDTARFEADLTDSATSAKVAADVALGKQLKIIGTPSAFLNSKPLGDGALGHFEQLIEHLAMTNKDKK
jgi:protein-disulfide isomerase